MLFNVGHLPTREHCMTELDSLRMTLGQTRALQLQSTTFRIEKQTELETRVNSVYLTGHENQFQVAPHLKLVIMANQLYVLYEHAAGYALFKVKEFEEIAMFIPQVEKATLNPVKFKSFVNLVAFLPFKSGTNALDNINSVSEGIVHEDLQAFLETNLPQNVKKSKFALGVSDGKIGSAIQEALGYSCQFTDVVPEILRGIRFHFHELVKGLSLSSLASAECSLGRSYSRAKVKFNVNRADNMVIQSISLIDQLDKDINTFSMRLKEWYSYHFPEMAKIVSDSYTYAKLAKAIGDRKEFYLTDDAAEKIDEIVQDPAKTQAILSASKSSMGMDISKIDLINIEMFTSKLLSLADYRKQLMDYLVSRMHNIAPNLSSLIGEIVGARLISHAGSLLNLSKYPSSTVQILGAEKALFRALKKKGNTPKYGLIYHSTFIGRAGNKNKGRISRFLANKCSIASRIDCFSEEATTVFGNKLKEQVEERLKFFDSGIVPKKNVDVMKEAIEEAAVDVRKQKKKKKKDKKRKLAEMEEPEEEQAEEEHTNGNAVNGDEAELVEEELPKKKKKKKSIAAM